MSDNVEKDYEKLTNSLDRRFAKQKEELEEELTEIKIQSYKQFGIERKLLILNIFLSVLLLLLVTYLLLFMWQ